MIFLARDGHLAFSGSPAEARSYFGVRDLADVYERLAGEHTPQIWAERFAQSVGTSEARPGCGIPPIPAHRSPSSTRARSGSGGYSRGAMSMSCSATG